jgi:hypothetical protein
VTRPDLADTIADWQGDAAVLRRNGNAAAAEILERCAREARDGAEDWLLWLSEGEAVTRSGFSLDTIRGRFEQLRRDGHARLVKRGVRQYRACAIPRRANATTAAQRGREAARAQKGKAA